MRRPCEEVRLELAGLAGGELDPDTASDVRSHLDECTACARELAELTETIAIVRAAPLQHEPSPDLERRAFELASLEQVGSMVSSAPLETEPPIDLEARSLVRAGVLDEAMARPVSRWARTSLVVAPGLAAAVVVFGFFATQWRSRIHELEESFGPMGQHVATQQLIGFNTANRASAELFDSEHTNYHLVLHAEHLPPTPYGFHYELWLSGAAGTVSAGSFRVRGPEDRVFPFTVGVKPSDYPHIEISLEPDDGDPSHTGATLMEADFKLP